jgi:hypothetical protein
MGVLSLIGLPGDDDEEEFAGLVTANWTTSRRLSRMPERNREGCAELAAVELVCQRANFRSTYLNVTPRR